MSTERIEWVVSYHPVTSERSGAEAWVEQSP